MDFTPSPTKEMRSIFQSFDFEFSNVTVANRMRWKFQDAISKLCVKSPFVSALVLLHFGHCHEKDMYSRACRSQKEDT